jgi:hypothetical protein
MFTGWFLFYLFIGILLLAYWIFLLVTIIDIRSYLKLLVKLERERISKN